MPFLSQLLLNHADIWSEYQQLMGVSRVFYLWFLEFITGDVMGICFRVLFISCLAGEEEPFLEVLCVMLRVPCRGLHWFLCF